MYLKPKVVYVLGHGYSGSTLLGLSLGLHPDVINLGEVINIENDYRDNQKCTCKKSLSECEFWNVIKTNTNNLNQSKSNALFYLDKKGRRERYDSRGGLFKLFIVLNIPIQLIFGKKEIERCRNKSVQFFTTLSRTVNSEYFTDLSKRPERLIALTKKDDLDVFCIYLKRQREEVFASILKRPKRTRAKYGFKIIREALWYVLRTKSFERAFKKLPANKKMILHWEDFCNRPTMMLNHIFQRLELSTGVTQKTPLCIELQEQHVFVGNRWLFKNNQKKIEIRKSMPNKTLSKIEKAIFKTFLFLFNLK